MDVRAAARADEYRPKWTLGMLAATFAVGIGALLIASTPLFALSSFLPLSHAWRAPAAVGADLDGDGADETVQLARGSEGIRITDGDVRYASRPKWRVVAAAIGDTDRNGLPEIVALLDGPRGRHLGLIGWHAGRYGERLVSSPLAPRPSGLTVRTGTAAGGDEIEVAEPEGSTTYRWNGFGFIAIAGRGAP